MISFGITSLLIFLSLFEAQARYKCLEKLFLMQFFTYAVVWFFTLAISKPAIKKYFN